MKLASVRVVTNDLDRLIAFYKLLRSEERRVGKECW